MKNTNKLPSKEGLRKAQQRFKARYSNVLTQEIFEIVKGASKPTEKEKPNKDKSAAIGRTKTKDVQF
jgi:hypothetical protein